MNVGYRRRKPKQRQQNKENEPRKNPPLERPPQQPIKPRQTSARRMLSLLACALMVTACASVSPLPLKPPEPAHIPLPPSMLTESKPEPVGAYSSALTTWRQKASDWLTRQQAWSEKVTAWRNEARQPQKLSAQ